MYTYRNTRKCILTEIHKKSLPTEIHQNAYLLKDKHVYLPEYIKMHAYRNT